MNQGRVLEKKDQNAFTVALKFQKVKICNLKILVLQEIYKILPPYCNSQEF